MSLSKSIFSITRMGRGLISVDSVYFGDWHNDQLWSLSKARKKSVCVLTDRKINVGDATYRPVTNKSNRSSRMLAEAVDKAYP